MSEARAAPDRIAAEILQAYRKLAGFRSATAAADHYGWPASRYRSHESGARAILEKDANQYAKAYGINTSMLLRPTAEFLRDVTDKVRRLEDDARRVLAARLRCARVLAGFDSGRQAAEAWSWATATYAKHEGAIHAISAAGIELYAAAFGVHASWLRDGQLPSGFGKELDLRMGQVLVAPEKFRELRRGLPQQDARKIGQFRDLIRPGRPRAFVGVKEYSWKDLEAAGGNLEKIEASDVWNVSPSFAPSTEGVFIVVAEVARRKGPDREWLFVLPTSAANEAQDYLVYENGELKIGPLINRPKMKVIGVILGRLRSPLSIG